MKIYASFSHVRRRCLLILLPLLFIFIYFIVIINDNDISGTYDSKTCPSIPALLAYDSLSLIRQHSISYRYNNTIIELNMKIQPQSCPINTRLIIIVFSKCSDFAVRSKLRKLWIKEARMERYTVYFLLGIEDYLEELVKQEAAEHEDIIFTDIREQYENLPLKTFVALLWKDKYCPQATWLLKLDVDTEVNVVNLIRLLKVKEGMKNVIYGQTIRNSYIERNHTKKWYVPMEAFSGIDAPKYVTGGAYLMSSDVPRKLLAAHMLCTYPYITVEDMYFTGILAEAAKVNRMHINEAYLYRDRIPFLYDFPYFCAERYRTLIYRNISDDKASSISYFYLFMSGAYDMIANVIC